MENLRILKTVIYFGGYRVSKKQVRRFLRGDLKELVCDCRSCEGAGDKWAVLRNKDDTIKVGCVTFPASVVRKIRVWARRSQ